MDDVQALLLKMREEQREDHHDLVNKVDEGFASVIAAAASHELKDVQRFAAVDNRLQVVENTRRTLRWLAGTAIVAFLGAAVDFFFVHLPKLIGKP